MNIQHDEYLDVLKLNNLLTTIDQRKKEENEKIRWKRKGRNVDVPYIFSFQPVVSLRAEQIGNILNKLGFSLIENEEKLSIKFNEEDPLLCNFRKNGELYSIDFPEIKWSMINVVPATVNKQPTNIRFKIQSFREVNTKVVETMEKYNVLLQCGKIFKATRNGFEVYGSHPLPRKTIQFAKEKDTEIYHNPNEEGSSPFKIEVSKVNELKFNADTMELQRVTDPRVEVTMIPGLPPLESSDEELKSYARYIWDKALSLGREFDNS